MSNLLPAWRSRRAAPGDIPRYGKHDSPGKLGVPLLFLCLGGVPQGVAVCVLRRCAGQQNDSRVDDLSFFRVVFLLLVVLGKQPFAALVSFGITLL